MVYIARFPAHKEMFVNMPLGMRIPMYCVAGGRAILSYMPESEARAILEASHRVAYTASTETDVERILEKVRQARRDGFAVANGEYYKGDITVSAPIIDSFGNAIGAINASVPSSRWEMPEVIDQLAPQVIEAARAVGGAVNVREYIR
jgi:IclR family pca regulon transcriptional regulator